MKYVYPKWLWTIYHEKGQRLKYQRKEHHKKKERDDSWREYKKIRKDKSKRSYSYSSRSGGHHFWFKNQSNRVERRSVNQQLHREDWDNWINFPPDYFCDPWGWD